MKINEGTQLLAFASGKPLFPVGEGGGETVAHDLLSGLHNRGYRVEAFGVIQLRDVVKLNSALSALQYDLEYESKYQEFQSHSGKRYEVPVQNACRYRIPYPVHLVPDETFLDYFASRLVQGRFPLALIQGKRSPQLVSIAQNHGAFPLFYVHNGPELGLFENPKALPLVLTKSYFFLEKIKREQEVNSELLYPAVDLDRYRIEKNSHECITMVNPVEVKGVVPFMKVAVARPDRKFLVLEGWGTPPRILEVMRKIPNITYLSKQLGMLPIYSRTHVLMVPSQWEEAFGRVIPEAQVNGIPVLASRVGGIPEAIGKGGVLVEDKENPEAWLKGLELLEARYDEYSARAKENAKRFSAEKAVTRLLEIIQSIQR